MLQNNQQIGNTEKISMRLAKGRFVSTKKKWRLIKQGEQVDQQS